MKIEQLLIDEFISRCKYKPYKKICKNILLGKKAYSLNSQYGSDESEYLAENIKISVQAYTSDKDMAISMYKDFVEFLRKKGYKIDITFPPIPVNNSFERQMFIAKYFHEENNLIKDLPEILWVGEKTLREDIKKLSGEDPIQVCGKKFCIPDMEKTKGKVVFASTLHPIFLSENLTQIIVMLKGLKAMAENPLYENYAKESASEIWNQLSAYARRRIRTVFKDIMPEELSWYESLKSNREESFYTEEMCGKANYFGCGIVLDCIKNEKSFAVEYSEDGKSVCYINCRVIPNTYRRDCVMVECNAGEKTLFFNKIIRSAYTPEELLAD